MTYEPKPYEIVGVTIAAHRQEDGSLVVPSSAGTIFEDGFPEKVRVNKFVYTLEETNDNPNPDSNLVWGEYA